MGNRDIWDEIEMAGHGEHLDEEMFEFVSAYADGECSAKERRLVEAYLAESAAARDLLAELRIQSAALSENSQDAPEWLRSAILAKTTERPRLRWPFAAGVGVTAAATASFAFVLWSPQPEQPSLARDLLATRSPQTQLPVVPSIEKPMVAPARPVASQTNELRKPERRPKSDPLYVSVKSQAPGGEALGVPEPAKLVRAEQVPDPEVSYAVAEYGGGKFETKQPDVEAVQTVGSQEPVPPKATSATVLPDAREKLRDKVKKMNEEKLEIDNKERVGSK